MVSVNSLTILRFCSTGQPFFILRITTGIMISHRNMEADRINGLRWGGGRCQLSGPWALRNGRYIHN
jgi:hypothetical protein